MKLKKSISNISLSKVSLPKSSLGRVLFIIICAFLIIPGIALLVSVNAFIDAIIIIGILLGIIIFFAGCIFLINWVDKGE